MVLGLRIADLCLHSSCRPMLCGGGCCLHRGQIAQPEVCLMERHDLVPNSVWAVHMAYFVSIGTQIL